MGQPEEDVEMNHTCRQIVPLSNSQQKSMMARSNTKWQKAGGSGKENGGKEDEFIFFSAIFFSKKMNPVVSSPSVPDWSCSRRSPRWAPS